MNNHSRGYRGKPLSLLPHHKRVNQGSPQRSTLKWDATYVVKRGRKRIRPTSFLSDDQIAGNKLLEFITTFVSELDDGTLTAIRNILSEEERLLKYLNTADSLEYEPVMQKYV